MDATELPERRVSSSRQIAAAIAGHRGGYRGHRGRYLMSTAKHRVCPSFLRSERWFRVIFSVLFLSNPSVSLPPHPSCCDDPPTSGGREIGGCETCGGGGLSFRRRRPALSLFCFLLSSLDRERGREREREKRGEREIQREIRR